MSKNKNYNKCAFCMAPAKNKCSRCQLVLYCNEECQKNHWKEEHKYSCFSPEERKASKQPDPRAVEESGNFEECCICLGFLSKGIQKLSCGHIFHKDCIDELRKKGVQQVCPLCRAELPDTPEKMFADGCQLFFQIKKDIDNNNNLWKQLNNIQQIKIKEVINLWTKCAIQGHVKAQAGLGVVYYFGNGVTQDYLAALMWFQIAANQGHKDSKLVADKIITDLEAEKTN